jgi:hypothetical protein
VEYQQRLGSSGGNLNEGRENGMGFGLTNTASVVSGGQSPVTGATEEYNGSSFTEKNDLNTARRSGAGAGSSTAGLVFGGQTPRKNRCYRILGWQLLD